MRYGIHSDRGLSYTELLVVIAVMAILATVLVGVFRNMNEASALRVSAQEVDTVLRAAQNNTLASNDSTVYGVHIDTDAVTLFVGQTYDPLSASNTVYVFQGTVVATTSLTGGVNDVVFARLTGYPSATGTIEVSNSGHTATNTITIHGTGLVER